MSILSNLYPPIIDTFMPAFIADDGCKIYFSISNYNNIEQINQKPVQVTIRNQKTNLSALNSSSYPSEVMLTEIKEDLSVSNEYKYYIPIAKTDMENNKFQIDEYYKVQIRFTQSDATSVSLTKPQQIDS